MTPYLTMNTTGEKDRIWVSCTCGWVGETRLVTDNAKVQQIMSEAAAEGRAHFDRDHPETSTGR